MVRTIAAATAAVLILLFAYTVYLTVTSGELVVPTNGVIGQQASDDPAEGQAGYDTLRARTQLQGWRTASGPSPGQPTPAAPTAATPAEDMAPASEAAEIAAPNGRELTRQWLAQRETQTDILQEPRRVQGITSVPGAERGVFVQPQGRIWRAAHNEWILYGGAIYMVGVAALLAVFLAIRGRVPLKEGFSGESVSRFNMFERANHWLTAVSFVLLALTGLVILYGKWLIRPWLGANMFGNLAEGSAWLHMALILPFAIGLVVMIVVWAWQNLPTGMDWEWLKRGGGFMSDEAPSPPADRFNAGQKLIFWAVIIGGLVLIASGIGMMLPFAVAGYTGIQIAQSIHAVAALVMIGIIFGHIYIGTVGMEGAFGAMWGGEVDRNWMREHHSVWYRRAIEPKEKKQQPAE